MTQGAVGTEETMEAAVVDEAAAMVATTTTVATTPMVATTKTTRATTTQALATTTIQQKATRTKVAEATVGVDVGAVAVVAAEAWLKRWEEDAMPLAVRLAEFRPRVPHQWAQS